MHDGTDSKTEIPEGGMLRKRRKGIYILPNLFTLAALFGGFYAIVMAMNGRYDMAAVGIFCAMVLDSLDGRVARMTNTQSAFGEQMDSLSDMVSFGAAPALISYIWLVPHLLQALFGSPPSGAFLAPSWLGPCLRSHSMPDSPWSQTCRFIVLKTSV
jgi:CDP-diacylglycerol---serine O-phosphatidyltransferase